MRSIIHIKSIFLFILLFTPAIGSSEIDKTSDSTESSFWKLFDDSKKFVRRSLKHNDPESLYVLGKSYKEGGSVKQDDAEAVKLFQDAADQGSAAARNALGYMYQQGRGVKKDNEDAVKWFSKAAEQNNSNAQYNLALMIFSGLGVQRDDELDLSWLRKAADQGHMHAEVLLAVIGKLNDKKTLIVLRSAAENGDDFALIQYGDLYWKGKNGVQQDCNEAVKWMRIAAEKGSVVAQNELYSSYRDGKKDENGKYVIQQDNQKALKWLRTAAHNELKVSNSDEILDFLSLSGANQEAQARAQRILGKIYSNGDIIRQDKKQAKKYFGMACDNGNEFGCRDYKKLNE